MANLNVTLEITDIKKKLEVLEKMFKDLKGIVTVYTKAQKDTTKKIVTALNTQVTALKKVKEAQKNSTTAVKQSVDKNKEKIRQFHTMANEIQALAAKMRMYNKAIEQEQRLLSAGKGYAKGQVNVLKNLQDQLKKTEAAHKNMRNEFLKKGGAPSLLRDGTMSRSGTRTDPDPLRRMESGVMPRGLGNDVKNVNKLNKSLNTTNQRMGILNTWWGKLSIIMSGFAATIFVFQNLFRWAIAFLSVGQKMQVAMAALNYEFKLTSEEYKNLDTITKEAGVSGFITSAEALEKIKKYKTEIGSTQGAVASLYEELRINDETYGETLDASFKGLLGTLRALNLQTFESLEKSLRGVLGTINEFLKKTLLTQESIVSIRTKDIQSKLEVAKKKKEMWTVPEFFMTDKNRKKVEEYSISIRVLTGHLENLERTQDLINLKKSDLWEPPGAMILNKEASDMDKGKSEIALANKKKAINRELRYFRLKGERKTIYDIDQLWRQALKTYKNNTEKKIKINEMYRFKVKEAAADVIFTMSDPTETQKELRALDKQYDNHITLYKRLGLDLIAVTKWYTTEQLKIIEAAELKWLSSEIAADKMIKKADDKEAKAWNKLLDMDVFDRWNSKKDQKELDDALKLDKKYFKKRIAEANKTAKTITGSFRAMFRHALQEGELDFKTFTDALTDMWFNMVMDMAEKYIAELIEPISDAEKYPGLSGDALSKAKDLDKTKNMVAAVSTIAMLATTAIDDIQLKTMASMAIAGAAAGFMIGGGPVGAVAGGIIGGIAGFFTGGSAKKKAKKEGDRALADINKQIDLLVSNAPSLQKELQRISDQFRDWELALRAAGVSFTERQLLLAREAEVVAQALRDSEERQAAIMKDSDRMIRIMSGSASTLTQEIWAINDAFDAWRKQLIDDKANLRELTLLEKRRMEAIKLALQNFMKDMMSAFDEANKQMRFLEYQFSTGSKSYAGFLMQEVRSMMGGFLSMDMMPDLSSLMSEWYSAAIAEVQAKMQEELDKLVKDQTKRRKEFDTAKAWERAADAVTKLIDQIEQTIKSIRYSGLNVALPTARLADAGTDYDTLKAAAMGPSSTQDDVQKFIQFAQTYLQEAQDRWKSSQEYQDIYAKVMADLTSVKGRVSGEDFLKRVYEEQNKTTLELEKLNAQFETEMEELKAKLEEIAEEEMKEINSVFRELQKWFKEMLKKLMREEDMKRILDINWSTTKEADSLITMLQEFVAKYGWDDPITLKLITEFFDNFSGPFEERMKFLGFIGKEAGWFSTAMIEFLKKDDNFNLKDFKDMMEKVGGFKLKDKWWLSTAKMKLLLDSKFFDIMSVQKAMWLLGFVGDKSGWNADAIIKIMAKLTDAGLTWENIKQTLINHGVTDRDVLIRIMVSYNAQFDMPKTLTDYKKLLEEMGLDKEMIASIMAKIEKSGDLKDFKMTDLLDILKDVGTPKDIVRNIILKLKGKAIDDIKLTADNKLAAALENGLDPSDELRTIFETGLKINTSLSQALDQGLPLSRSAQRDLREGLPLNTLAIDLLNEGLAPSTFLRNALNEGIGAGGSLKKIFATGIGVNVNIGGGGGSGSIKRRAIGGPVSPNSPYMVGEQGPELFVPNTSGTIVPSGSSSVINLTVEIDGEKIEVGEILAVADYQRVKANRRPGNERRRLFR